MSYKSILVHTKQGNHSKPIIDAGSHLAARFDAHLTGIYVSSPMISTLFVEGSIPNEYLQHSQNGNLEDTKSLFEKSVKAAGCLYDWLEVTGRPDEEIAKRGVYADLIILGQSGDIQNNSETHALQNHVLLASSRPILIVPYIGLRHSLGKHIMVAWNGSNEAIRAINDALPLLKTSDIVEVVTVNKSSSQDQIQAMDVCRYLSRHGVNAEASSVHAGDLSTTNVLLNRASEKDVDLIVMGAYGHSRLREYVLGGATYNMLKSMTVPVLMSR